MGLCGQEAVFVSRTDAHRSWTIRLDLTRGSQVLLNQATKYLQAVNPKGEILWLADGSLYTDRPFTSREKLSGAGRRRRGSPSGKVSIEGLERQLSAASSRDWSADSKSYISLRHHRSGGLNWSWAPRIHWSDGESCELILFVLLEGTNRRVHRSLEKSGVFRNLRRSLHQLGFQTREPRWNGKGGSAGASIVFVERLGLSATAALELARRLQVWSPGLSL
jgi:hypothetical protein